MKKILFSLIILSSIFIVSCDKTPELTTLENTVWRGYEVNDIYYTEYRFFTNGIASVDYVNEGISDLYPLTYNVTSYNSVEIYMYGEYIRTGKFYPEDAKLYIEGEGFRLVSY